MCSVEGCTKPRRTRGWCNAHYERWRRHGNLGSAILKPWGVTACQIAGCDRPHRSSGYCKLHWDRWYKHGDPLLVLPSSGAPPRPGPANPAWRGDDIGYTAAHERVKAERGSASTLACQHCGKQAAHWAYDHGDRAERIGDDGHGQAMVYSLDLVHYLPLCVPCHRKFDVSHRSMV